MNLSGVSPSPVWSVPRGPHAVADRRRARRPPFRDRCAAGRRSSDGAVRAAQVEPSGRAFQEARKAYDYIIVDTPPLVAVPDCRVLANVVDGFLVVVTAHRTPKRLLEDALNVLEPAKTIGLVYNGDERPLSGYYSREYGATENGNGHRKWPWRRK